MLFSLSLRENKGEEEKQQYFDTKDVSFGFICWDKV